MSVKTSQTCDQRKLQIFKRITFLLFFFFTSFSESQNSQSHGPSQLPSTHEDQLEKVQGVKAPTPASDRENLRILNSLIHQSGWFPEIKITVVDGMVTIQGNANGKEQLDWLEKTAERLPSVIAVINKAELTATALTELSPALKELRSMVDMAKRTLPSIVLALILFATFFFMSRFLRRGILALWERKITNPFLLSTVSKLTLLPIWLLFFYLVLRAAGLSALATTIIGGTGMLGLILGLAFRGIAENYLSGLLLAMRSPFTKGDLIEIGEHLGYVQNLTMRGTTIINLDGNLILIPNSTVIQSIVQNRTVNPLTRTSFIIGIAYSDSISRAQELILKNITEVRGVLKDPEPSVLVDDFGASSVNLKILFWFDIKATNQPRVRSRAMIHIKELLLANGFTIPDEAREIVFADTLKIRMLDSKEEVKNTEVERKHKIIEKASVNLEDKRNEPEKHEETQDKNLMRLAAANPLMTERPKDNLLKP